jgi:hypothetical protein
VPVATVPSHASLFSCFLCLLFVVILRVNRELEHQERSGLDDLLGSAVRGSGASLHEH